MLAGCPSDNAIWQYVVRSIGSSAPSQCSTWIRSMESASAWLSYSARIQRLLSWDGHDVVGILASQHDTDA